MSFCTVNPNKKEGGYSTLVGAVHIWYVCTSSGAILNILSSSHFKLYFMYVKLIVFYLMDLFVLSPDCLL